jgi:hypothetical protein
MARNLYFIRVILVILVLIFLVPIQQRCLSAEDNTKSIPFRLQGKLYSSGFPDTTDSKELGLQEKQILDEVAKSKVPTISAAEYLVKEYLKRIRCPLKAQDEIRVIGLKKYDHDMPPITLKGDLIWIVAIRLSSPGKLPNSIKYLYDYLYINASIGQVFMSSGEIPLIAPGYGWSWHEPGPPVP